jgi:DNA-binding XRE family transcriptional regulator
MLHHGSIPEGMRVLHTCDLPTCVNPDHLFLGSQGDNARDMVRKGRANPIVGEKSRLSKLKEEDVRAILRCDERASDIASRLGVSRTTIHKIRSGKNWSHISKESSPCQQPPSYQPI